VETDISTSHKSFQIKAKCGTGSCDEAFLLKHVRSATKFCPLNKLTWKFRKKVRRVPRSFVMVTVVMKAPLIFC